MLSDVFNVSHELHTMIISLSLVRDIISLMLLVVTTRPTARWRQICGDFVRNEVKVQQVAPANKSFDRKCLKLYLLQ